MTLATQKNDKEALKEAGVMFSSDEGDSGWFTYNCSDRKFRSTAFYYQLTKPRENCQVARVDSSHMNKRSNKCSSIDSIFVDSLGFVIVAKCQL